MPNRFMQVLNRILASSECGHPVEQKLDGAMTRHGPDLSNCDWARYGRCVGFPQIALRTVCLGERRISWSSALRNKLIRARVKRRTRAVEFPI